MKTHCVSGWHSREIGTRTDQIDTASSLRSGRGGVHEREQMVQVRQQRVARGGAGRGGCGAQEGAAVRALEHVLMLRHPAEGCAVLVMHRVDVLVQRRRDVVRPVPEVVEGIEEHEAEEQVQQQHVEPRRVRWQQRRAVAPLHAPSVFSGRAVADGRVGPRTSLGPLRD